MRKVMAFGTFDGLHPGHLYYLRKARALGDYLIVVVARGRNARIIKGRGPVGGEEARLRAVQKLRIVDQAILGGIEIRKWNVIKKHRPVVIALGYDQWASGMSLRKKLRAIGLSPQIVRIGAFKPAKYKSSRLKEKGSG